jgi:cell wall-associated NlpC family hydrolase
MARLGTLVKPNQPLEIGDLVYYGSNSAPGYPFGHVAVYGGHGFVVSHGGVGVNLLPVNYRAIGEVRRYIT